MTKGGPANPVGAGWVFYRVGVMKISTLRFRARPAVSLCEITMHHDGNRCADMDQPAILMFVRIEESAALIQISPAPGQAL